MSGFLLLDGSCEARSVDFALRHLAEGRDLITTSHPTPSWAIRYRERYQHRGLHPTRCPPQDNYCGNSTDSVFFSRKHGSKGEIGLRNRSKAYRSLLLLPADPAFHILASFGGFPIDVTNPPTTRVHRQHPGAAEWQNGRTTADDFTRTTRSNCPFRGTGAIVQDGGRHRSHLQATFGFVSKSYSVPAWTNAPTRASVPNGQIARRMTPLPWHLTAPPRYRKHFIHLSNGYTTAILYN